MSELTASKVREQLAQYVEGNLTPQAFRNWLALCLRDAHQSSDKEVGELAHRIEWQFFDVERGIVSPEALRTNLAYLCQKHPEQNPMQNDRLG